MGLTPSRAPTVAELMASLLDRGYTRAAGAVLDAVSANGSSGVLKRRLAELEQEAARLAAEGVRMTPQNPVMRALIADLEDVMRANAALVNSASEGVQASGIQASSVVQRQLALPGVSDAQLRALGVRWNVPNPEAVAQVVNYAESDAWAALLGKYQTGTVDTVRTIAVRGMTAGWGPLRIAREVHAVVTGLPTHEANVLLRTLQLTAMRDADVVHRVSNAAILEYQIRIAALDDRTCMACVALHGERLPIDARIDDHHAGRCTSITVVKGIGEPAGLITGEQWFARRTPEQQRAQMGNAAFEAWQAGAITLKDFPKPYTDPVFGRMVREASLKGMLGPDAKAYYAQ